jgi:hypothetical protein
VANTPSESCRSTKSSTPLNQGLEHVLGELQQLEKLGLGHQPWSALSVIAEENRAEVNFEWSSGSPRAKSGTGPTWAPASPRAEKRLQDPQDVLIEGRPPAAAAEEEPGTARLLRGPSTLITPVWEKPQEKSAGELGR